MTDAIALVINLLSDSVRDDVGAADAVANSVFASKVENLGVKDDKILTVAINRADGADAADAGSYRGQGYCDFAYFADDYVGYSGTF
jgi:hypothetical protein